MVCFDTKVRILSAFTLTILLSMALLVQPNAAKAVGSPMAHPSFEGDKKLVDVKKGSKRPKRITLAVPAGLRGLTPELSLNHNDFVYDGTLGVGWTLNVAESISLCHEKSFFQPISKAETLEMPDPICFNGRKFQLNPRYYRRVDGETLLDRYNNTYLSVRSNSSGLFFTLYAQNGLFYEYGSDFDSKVRKDGFHPSTLVWHVRRITDRFGNSIQYRYSKDGLYSRLTKIRYAKYVVHLRYQYYSSPPVNGEYEPIKPEDALISEILVQSNGKTLMGYQFDYDFYGTGRRLLRNITKLENNKEVAVTRFNWELQGEAFAQVIEPIRNDFTGESLSEFDDALIAGTLNQH